jgi:hypothetical protein
LDLQLAARVNQGFPVAAQLVVTAGQTIIHFAEFRVNPLKGTKKS